MAKPKQRFAYFVSYLFTGPQGILGHGDATFTLEQELTPNGVNVVKDWVTTQLRRTKSVPETGEPSVSLMNIVKLTPDVAQEVNSPPPQIDA